MIPSGYLLLAAGLSLIDAVAGTNDVPAGTGTFTVINGQIFTPGLAVVDAPQPFTPLGGDFLQVALDITGSGRLPWPDNPSDSPTVIHNITLFLTSYITGFNFTISNATTANTSGSNVLGTTTDSDSGTDKGANSTAPPLGNILVQELSSTVKHVNWLWPSCLVGNGPPSTVDGIGDNVTSARGAYNISIHQSYRLNGSEFYTIFDLPISVTNEIPDTPSAAANGNDPAPGPVSSDSASARVSCGLLQNSLLDWSVVNASVNAPTTQPYLGGSVVVSGTSAIASSGNGRENGKDGIDSTSGATMEAASWSREAVSGIGLAAGLLIVGQGFVYFG